MHRRFTLVFVTAGVLALLFGTVVWDGQRARRGCAGYPASLTGNGARHVAHTETAWAWLKLEWECVVTTRTGRVFRVDDEQLLRR